MVTEAVSQPCAPGARVRIYQLAREFDLWFQLCRPCLGVLMNVRNWQKRVDRAPPFGDLRCDRCEKGIV